jgi:hypothetical protein
VKYTGRAKGGGVLICGVLPRNEEQNSTKISSPLP